MALLGTQVVTKATSLKRFWNKRDDKMKDWYEQIKMVDTLAQKDMESFVSNDPRASFNLISSILNQRIPHRLPAGKLDIEQVRPAAELSEMFDTIWENILDDYRQRGRYFQKDIVDYLLATGWYAVFAAPTTDGSTLVAEVWNPITVYPKWSNILTECAHIFAPGQTTIEFYAARNGWNLKSSPSDSTTIYDYWWVEQELTNTIVHNSIVVGNEQVKPDTIEPTFSRIPVFVSPVAGLPDSGELAKGTRGNEWKQDIGQSFIATNENVYRAVNKWWTFMMQLLRDTAQARTYEKTASSKQIVHTEDWYRRGAHYKLGLQDEIGIIQPSSVPVELRSLQLDLEAMEQRGGPSWTMFGSIQQRMTAYAMAQVAATTNQIARYYHQGIIDLFTDMDNFFLQLIKKNNFRPYGMGLPKGLPPDAKLTAAYELRIPGDLVQRATTARMLQPGFELSDERVMEELFPEIKNPTEELGRVRGSKARKHPIYVAISLAASLKQEATILREAKDISGAELFEKAAERVEREISGEAQQPPQALPAKVPIRPEVLPPTAQKERR